MKRLNCFFERRNGLSPLPQATLDFWCGGMLLILFGFLISLIIPVLFLLVFLGLFLLAVGNLFFVLSAVQFIFKKIKQ